MRISTSFWLGVVGVLLIGIVFTGCGGSKTTISSLTISPAKLAPDQTITIGANILNSGTKSEEYSAILKIDDANVETKQMTIGPGETKTLSFQYIPQILGTYQVDVNGQAGAFEVVKPAEFVVEPLSVTPDVPTLDSEITASIKVQNNGDLGGTYTALLKVDGRDVE